MVAANFTPIFAEAKNATCGLKYCYGDRPLACFLEKKKLKSINNYGWIFLLIAMSGDLIVSFLLSFFYKDYSNIKMSISALGSPNSPIKIPFNIWMFFEGLLFLISLPTIYNYFKSTSPKLTVVLLIIISVFAIGACIFTSFFSVNETKNITTVASKIHGIGSTIGFCLFLFVPLLISILYFKSSENLFGTISIICFILSLVFFVLFIMSDKETFSSTVIANEGLWQRLNLLFMYIPLCIVCLQEMRNIF